MRLIQKSVMTQNKNSISIYDRCKRICTYRTTYYAAIKNDGSLYAWGDNSFGAIGIGKAPNIDFSENSNDYAEPVPVKVVDNVKAVTHDSVNRMMYLKNNGSLWAAGSGKYGVLSELDEENSTQYNFYRNPILITLITLKGKSPSLTVKDDNNSGTTDPRRTRFWRY